MRIVPLPLWVLFFYCAVKTIASEEGQKSLPSPSSVTKYCIYCIRSSYITFLQPVHSLWCTVFSLSFVSPIFSVGFGPVPFDFRLQPSPLIKSPVFRRSVFRVPPPRSSSLCPAARLMKIYSFEPATIIGGNCFIYLVRRVFEVKKITIL